jgi:hypothetical protein
VDIDLEGWSAQLPPAHYRLVPVDARGVELPHLPVVERVLGDMRRLTDQDAVVAAAVSHLLDSPAFTDHLSDQEADADRHALMRSAIPRASGEVFVRRKSGDLADSDQHDSVEALVARTLDILDESDDNASGTS